MAGPILLYLLAVAGCAVAAMPLCRLAFGDVRRVPLVSAALTVGAPLALLLATVPRGTGWPSIFCEHDHAPPGLVAWSRGVRGRIGLRGRPARAPSYSVTVIGAVFALVYMLYGVFIMVRTMVFGVDLPGYESV